MEVFSLIYLDMPCFIDTQGNLLFPGRREKRKRLGLRENREEVLGRKDGEEAVAWMKRNKLIKNSSILSYNNINHK